MLNLLRAELLRLISNRKVVVLGAFVLGLGFWISASMTVALRPYTALDWDEARRLSNDAQINLEVICGSSSSNSDCAALPTNITVEGFLRPQMSFEQFVVASLEPTMQMGLLMVVVFVLVAWMAKSWRLAVGTAVTFLIIISLGQWVNAMETLVLVTLATLTALVFAVPLGIWAARNKYVSVLIRPVLDLMQTMPAFVYLIPSVLFFSIGVVPGMFATQ